MTEGNPDTLAKLRGQLERITYEDLENGYVVARVRVFGQSDLVTIVGNIPSLTPGEILSMSGKWTSHLKFGQQFQVVFCSCSVPASVVGIEKYLGSGLIKGIGPGLAKRIVSVFKEQTLEIIENTCEKLLEIPGIGNLRIQKISQAWREQKEVREVMVFLQVVAKRLGCWDLARLAQPKEQLQLAGIQRLESQSASQPESYQNLRLGNI